VISLSETWLDACSPLSFFNIPNYTFVSHPRSNDKRGGGVAFYVHSSLIFSEILMPNLKLQARYESITIKITNSITTNIIITTIYEQPDYDIQEFNTSFCDFLDSTDIKNKLY
jgi:hypothetical protein